MEGEKNTAPTGITALISAALSALHNLPLCSNATSHTHGEHMCLSVLDAQPSSEHITISGKERATFAMSNAVNPEKAKAKERKKKKR